MGQRIDYNGEIIEVEGVGAQTDDFSQIVEERKSSGTLTKVGTGIREGNIDVPVPAQDTTNTVGGGGTQLDP